MIKPIRRIVIVGGGTSGWLTAAFLLKKIRKNTEVVVIDKKQSETVGVGEATILSFKQFMNSCGFPVDEWLPCIDATFKSGILFTDWQREGTDLWHPFAFPEYNAWETNLLNIWTNHKDKEFFTHGCALYHPAVTENKVDPTNIGTYANHIDCGKLVEFIKSKILDKITFVSSEVIDVNRNQNGGINYITIEGGEQIESDIFVDCTGWKRLLGAEPDTVDCRDRLFCDTAVAGHVPYENIDEELTPYTKCCAVDHGWIWKIPTQTRIGSGLVFNRSITDPEEAKDYFVEHWNHRIDRESLKVLDWTPYYHNNFWQDNVVCIGLSAGFIEPLESTGVALICAGIIELAEAFKGNFYNTNDILAYNVKMKCFFEGCVDFVNMHYSRNQRTTGKFWEFVQDTFKFTETQKFYEYEVQNNPYELPRDGDYMFVGENWSVFMAQLLDKDTIEPKNNGLSFEQSKGLLEQFYENEIEKHKNSILHREFVEQCLGKIKSGIPLNISYNCASPVKF